MAFCANCGREISAAALTCPNCGHPNQLRATPTGAQLAGFWMRFGAWLIDAIAVNIVAFFVIRPAGFGLWFFYNWLMLGLNDGKTLGKMALGLRVAHPDGGKMSLGTAAARAAMALVSGLAIGIGYLWAVWDPEKRTWHDMVADTQVFATR